MYISLNPRKNVRAFRRSLQPYRELYKLKISTFSPFLGRDIADPIRIRKTGLVTNDCLLGSQAYEGAHGGAAGHKQHV